MTQLTPTARRDQWLWIGTIWLAFGLVDAAQTVLVMRAENMHHAWAKLFAVTVIKWLPWGLATPLVMRTGRSFPPVRFRSAPGWLVHLAACAALGVAYSAWETLLDNALNPYAYPTPLDPFLGSFLHGFYNCILSNIVLYGAILAVSYVLDSKVRLAQQEIEAARLNALLAKAQLDALRRQIEPHFLFNTLNAVAGLVREGKGETAVTMIAGLSDFLRRMLDENNRQEVRLEEEMKFAQKYLDIQKVRFAERLDLSVNVPAELLAARVPVLILQLMLENAIKHGIAKRAQGGSIRIAAARNEDHLRLSVYNDGPSLPVDWEMAGVGVGISNMRARLHSLYGNAFELHFKNGAKGGVEVSVTMPFHASSERD